ncbi:MAG: radical SAM family heme chaperone HemW [Planctomycetota bacterium]|jgi:oxygen-independent coproporphyrinogen-3 oxidase|nr:radical SAM family heme chaperone HemW [Planctomycetota bacterium]
MPRPSRPGLYVHIPFCRSRCPYCSFVSGDYEENLADAYLEALGTELGRRRVFSGGKEPESVYIGGGTPSALSARQWKRLLEVVPGPAPGGEFTCELNPDSADREKLAILRDNGVNRCSFGVQTFDPAGLSLLGRRHGASLARRALETAAGLGFESLSLDLIHAWPGQTPAAYARDLSLAAGLGVNHLSCYGLSLEPGTVLAARLEEAGWEKPGEEEELAFWRLGEDFLAERGFEHYETSNFARPGFACRHNLEIWKGGEYLGIGAAAHSHLAGRRFANSGEVRTYLAVLAGGRLPEAFSETLAPREKARECAVFWLRLSAGVDLEEFRARTGFDFLSLYAGELPDLLERGCLVLDPAGKNIRVPPRLQPVLDAILPELV